MCYLRVQHATLSYVYVTHGWAAFLLLSASQDRDSKAARLPMEMGEERWREGAVAYQEHLVKWNEVPFVADKIILLPWPASRKWFERNKCGLLCCWQTTKSLADIQIDICPRKKGHCFFKKHFTFILKNNTGSLCVCSAIWAEKI